MLVGHGLLSLLYTDELDQLSCDIFEGQSQVCRRSDQKELATVSGYVRDTGVGAAGDIGLGHSELICVGYGFIRVIVEDVAFPWDNLAVLGKTDGVNWDAFVFYLLGYAAGIRPGLPPPPGEVGCPSVNRTIARLAPGRCS